MDDFIESIQSGTADAFLTLPFIIIGFAFFFGVLTSNIGTLLLFFAHIIIVPATSFLLNEKVIPFETSKTIKYILAFLVSGYFLFADTDGSSGWSITKYVLVPVFYLIHLYNQFSSETKTTSKACAVIPGMKPDELVYYNPSAWLSHITFFTFFVLSNALIIYNLPAPDLNLTDNTKQNKDRQANLDSRVRNRKIIAVSVILVALLAFSILLYFRFAKTSCESGFLKSIPALALTGFAGASFVNWIYEFCGVNPVDILGIVQGIVNPDLLDNPIVCVGS